jgi:hypothetical protein
VESVLVMLWDLKMFAVGGIWGCSSRWFVEESSLEILSEFLDTDGVQVFFVFEVIFLALTFFSLNFSSIFSHFFDF